MCGLEACLQIDLRAPGLVIELSSPIAIIYISIQFEVTDSRSNANVVEYEVLNAMRDYALQHQIDVIDTKPYLYQKLEANESTVEDIYWPIDMHFTELGYRYFAEAINIALRPKINRAREAEQLLVGDSVTQ
jgi:hypothetical protein